MGIPKDELHPISAWLLDHGRGDAHWKASTELQELIRAVEEHEKGGSLTIKIAVKSLSEGQVAVQVTSTLAAPQADAKPRIYFTDEAGHLLGHNPQQPVLPPFDTELAERPTYKVINKGEESTND